MNNHLLQSTIFAAAAAMLTLLLRNNHARTRYWIWLIASMKFLVPFSLFVEFGHRITWPTTLLAVWISGAAAVLLYWIARWHQVAKILRTAIPIEEGRVYDSLRRLEGLNQTRIVSSQEQLEPGVFGIVRPVLYLPAGIAEHLNDAQLDAILAHELSHIRRKDNLTAALHMLVEAVFWFHPLVWWIGARLVAERERACDEEAVRLGAEPEVYAESILKICKLYLESPLACVSGVTGSDLKKRIETIMTKRVARALNPAKKVALAVAGITVLSAPVFTGIIHAPIARAQSDTPKFEVASIRRCTMDAVPAGGARGSGATSAFGDARFFRTPCLPVQMLIRTAYIRFADGHRPSPESDLKNQPLQGDRATKEVPVYALLVAKGRPRFQRTKDVAGQPLPCGFEDGDETGVRAVGVPAANLLHILEGELSNFVTWASPNSKAFHDQLVAPDVI